MIKLFDNKQFTHDFSVTFTIFQPSVRVYFCRINRKSSKIAYKFANILLKLINNQHMKFGVIAFASFLVTKSIAGSIGIQDNTNWNNQGYSAEPVSSNVRIESSQGYGSNLVPSQNDKVVYGQAVNSQNDGKGWSQSQQSSSTDRHNVVQDTKAGWSGSQQQNVPLVQDNRPAQDTRAGWSGSQQNNPVQDNRSTWSGNQQTVGPVQDTRPIQDNRPGWSGNQQNVPPAQDNRPAWSGSQQPVLPVQDNRPPQDNRSGWSGNQQTVAPVQDNRSEWSGSQQTVPDRQSGWSGNQQTVPPIQVQDNKPGWNGNQQQIVPPIQDNKPTWNGYQQPGPVILPPVHVQDNRPAWNGNQQQPVPVAQDRQTGWNGNRQQPIGKGWFKNQDSNKSNNGNKGGYIYPGSFYPGYTPYTFQYTNQLPSSDEVTRVVSSGRSKDIKDFVYGACQLQVPTQDSNQFVEDTFGKVRSQISQGHDDIDDNNRNKSIYEESINFLNGHLNDLSRGVKSSTFLNQLQQLKVDNARHLDTKNSCSNDVQKYATQFESEQANLSNLVSSHRRSNRGGSNSDIDNARSRVRKAKSDLDDARSRFNTASLNYDVSSAKISHGDTFFNISNTQQRSNAIRSKISEIQSGLDSCNSRLGTVKPTYDDLVSNYDDLSKVRETNYNSAYKTIYNDDQDEFKDDNNGGAYFDGRDSLGRYTQKVFGFGPAQGNIKTNNQDPFSRYNSNQQVQVNRCNVISPTWGSTHGNPLDSDNGSKGGQTFEQNNFACDVNNKNNLPSFKGRVVSFSKNVARVVNDRNQECQLNLSGSSRIQVAGKQLPQAGDDVYWKGTQQGSGQRGKQYNAHHVFCF